FLVLATPQTPTHTLTLHDALPILVIGRDPATCNIVFDKNTPGISGRHCQVVYDPNEDCFIITDLGSSYGTFLGNGKKLTANVAEKLSTGDTFYLCDNANRFVVSKE